MKSLFRQRPPPTSSETDPLIPNNATRSEAYIYDPENLSRVVSPTTPAAPAARPPPRKNISLYIIGLLAIILLTQSIDQMINSRIRHHWVELVQSPPGVIESLVHWDLIGPVEIDDLNNDSNNNNDNDNNIIKGATKLLISLDYSQVIRGERSNYTSLEQWVWDKISRADGLVKVEDWEVDVSMLAKDGLQEMLAKVRGSDRRRRLDLSSSLPTTDHPALQFSIQEGVVSNLDIPFMVSDIPTDIAVYRSLIDDALNNQWPLITLVFRGNISWQQLNRWSLSRIASWIIGKRSIEITHTLDSTDLFAQPLPASSPELTWDSVVFAPDTENDDIPWALDVSARWVNYDLPVNFNWPTLNLSVLVPNCKNQEFSPIEVAQIITDSIHLIPHEPALCHISVRIPALSKRLLAPCERETDDYPDDNDHPQSALDQFVAAFLSSKPLDVYVKLSPNQPEAGIPRWLTNIVSPLSLSLEVPPLSHGPDDNDNPDDSDDNKGLLRQLTISDVSLQAASWVSVQMLGVTIGAHINAVVALPYSASNNNNNDDNNNNTKTTPSIEYGFSDSDLAVVALRATTLLYFESVHFANLNTPEWIPCESTLISFNNYTANSYSYSDSNSSFIDSIMVDAVLDKVPLEIVDQMALSRLTRALWLHGVAEVAFDASVDLRLRLLDMDEDGDGVVLSQLPISGVTELTSG